MWHYPQFDPVAISLGPVSIHWYALSYLVGISLVWWQLGQRSRKHKLGWSEEQISDMVFYSMFGIILGGRIGYMAFYGWQGIIDDPLRIVRIWEGGMSYHGGMLGVFLAMYLYGRKIDKTFFQITDFIAPSIPIALCCGRIGNFINGELPGRVTEVPWAAIYPGDIVGRHPSSLYQALFEGPILWLVLWLFSRTSRPRMAVSAMFLIGYGCLRFGSEFLREPDRHLSYIAFDWLTMGQLLSSPMIIIGLVFLYVSYRRSRGKS